MKTMEQHLNIGFWPDLDPLFDVWQIDDVIGKSCQMFSAIEDVPTHSVFESGQQVSNSNVRPGQLKRS